MGFSVPPGYRRTAEIKRPKLDGFTGFIDQWLQEDLSRNRKQRHTAKRIFERLRDEHDFKGGYTTSRIMSANMVGVTARCLCRWLMRPVTPKRISARPWW